MNVTTTVSVSSSSWAARNDQERQSRRASARARAARRLAKQHPAEFDRLVTDELATRPPARTLPDSFEWVPGVS